MNTYRFEIHEQTTYWQTGHVSVEAPTKKQAITRILNGEYNHEGDNEVVLDTEGPQLAIEVYEKGKVKKGIINGKTISIKDLQKIHTTLKCALLDLKGLAEEAYPDGLTKEHAVRMTLSEIHSLLKAPIFNK